MNTKKNITIKGGIRDIGSSGMFFISNETIPVPAVAEITINFDTVSNKPEFILKAYGKTVRAMPNGVGIEFTKIDLTKLQQCIIARINGTDTAVCRLNSLSNKN